MLLICSILRRNTSTRNLQLSPLILHQSKMEFYANVNSLAFWLVRLIVV